jgi:glycerol-3-phosphate dehydrogenase subunit B
VGKTDINAAFEDLFTFLEGQGLGYKWSPEKNVEVITPMGTLKTTYGVPETMWPGVAALEKKCPCALVGITGLKGYSVKLMADRLQPIWPKLKPVVITFPGTGHGHDLYPEHLANALVVSRNRQRLLDVLKPHVQDAEAVAMPAILGLYNSRRVVSEMTDRMGIAVFEIPTMPPGISGMRLKAAFENGLRDRGVTYEPQKRVMGIEPILREGFELHIGNKHIDARIRSKGVILATGRFIGGGLSADRKRIRETLLDLPVHQPDQRAAWHREDLFDARGHAINMAGLETDDQFRPLGKDGTAAFETLYAAGSILAHQDWKRTKCGVGLAVATAYKAVQSFASFLEPSDR